MQSVVIIGRSSLELMRQKKLTTLTSLANHNMNCGGANPPRKRSKTEDMPKMRNYFEIMV